MPDFTEPEKTTPVYTEPQWIVISEATIKDLNEATIKDLNEMTMKEINEKYGKKYKVIKPTFTKPTKGTVTYTEPSKGD